MRLLFLTVVLLLCVAIPAKADDYVFRKTKWGMSINEIEKMEREEKSHKSEYEFMPRVGAASLTYIVEMFQSVCIVQYNFPDSRKNKLNSIYVLIPFPAFGKSNADSSIDEIIRLLVKKYGPDYAHKQGGVTFNTSDTNITLVSGSDSACLGLSPQCAVLLYVQSNEQDNLNDL